jgi:hypothetical protein
MLIPKIADTSCYISGCNNPIYAYNTHNREIWNYYYLSIGANFIEHRIKDKYVHFNHQLTCIQHSVPSYVMDFSFISGYAKDLMYFNRLHIIAKLLDKEGNDMKDNNHPVYIKEYDELMNILREYNRIEQIYFLLPPDSMLEREWLHAIFLNGSSFQKWVKKSKYMYPQYMLKKYIEHNKNHDISPADACYFNRCNCESYNYIMRTVQFIIYTTLLSDEEFAEAITNANLDLTLHDYMFICACIHGVTENIQINTVNELCYMMYFGIKLTRKQIKIETFDTLAAFIEQQVNVPDLLTLYNQSNDTDYWQFIYTIQRTIDHLSSNN